MVLPGDKGVGSAVAVSCGDAVTGVAEGPPVEEQAVNSNSPMNKIVDVFFIGDMMSS
jgi:hypothetical protein